MDPDSTTGSNFCRLGQLLVYINALRRTAIWKADGGTGPCRGQMRVLRCILEPPGCGQKDVAEQLYISPAAVADICKRLEQEALIERTVVPDNRRCEVLFATDKGRQVSQKHRETFAQVDKQTFQGFSTQDLDTLKGLLMKMMENLGGCQADPMKIFAQLEEKDRKKVR